MKWLVCLLFPSVAFAAKGRSTYDVWDFEFISANEYSGRTLRIAVVNDRQHQDTLPDYEGTDALGENDRRAIPVGQFKQLEMNFITLQSIGTKLKTEIKALNGANAIIANVHHLKSCPVDVVEKDESKIIGDSSKGIITVPKVVTFKTRRFTAACATPDDQVVEQKRTATPQDQIKIAAARKQNADQNSSRELAFKIESRVTTLENEFYRKVQTVKLAPTPQDELHKAFCPDTAALMTAAEITQVRVDKAETKHIEHKGYTEIAHSYTLVIVPAKGEALKHEDADFRDIGNVNLVLKRDSKTCLSVTASQTPNREQLRKDAETIHHSLKRFVHDRFEEQAGEELKALRGAASP